MTLGGPRPERPEIAAQYCKTIPEFALRLQAKAGLTGYAQVYGKYNTTPYDKLQMDLMYMMCIDVCIFTDGFVKDKLPESMNLKSDHYPQLVQDEIETDFYVGASAII